MDWVVETEVACPHCGEPNLTTVDTSQGSSVMIEDCTVCCAPMELSIRCHAGEIESVDVRPG